MNTDQRPTITPEEGKRYVTRDGQMTNPLRPYLSVFYPFIAEVGEFCILHAWTRRGRCDHTSPDPHPLDLVAEYVESPTADDHANDLRDAVRAMAAQTPPLKNRSGTPTSITSGSNLGHPQAAIVIGYDMASTPEPHPLDGWHGPLKGPLRPGPCELSKDVARWHRGQWDFTGWKGNTEVLYLVRKGSPVAKALGLEPAYPDHTPPELPSPWHRWEYRGTGVSGLASPYYFLSPRGNALLAMVGKSRGTPTLHYFEAVPDIPLIKVNGIWFPEPHREPLERGQSYYLAVPGATDSFLPRRWGYYGSDNRWLASGLIHLTREAAAAHSKAMLSLAETRDIVKS